MLRQKGHVNDRVIGAKKLYEQGGDSDEQDPSHSSTLTPYPREMFGLILY